MTSRARRLVATLDHSIVSSIVAESDQRHGPDGLTLVLLREDGTVGFTRDDGEIVADLVQGNVVLVERKNHPQWRSADQRSIVTSALHVGWSYYVSCTEPSKVFMDELDVVSRNEVVERKNQILARHGKPPHALTHSRFDEWLVADGRIDAILAAWMIRECHLVAVWDNSTWGRYVCMLTHDSDKIVSQCAVAVRELGIEFELVESRARLPCW